MSPKKLGRGLDALIPRTSEIGTPLEVQHVDPKLIAVNRSQPRANFDDGALDELAQSIRTQGILQPLVVRVNESGRYELIAGERRLRASLKLELDCVPVLVRNVDSTELLELALIENIQREDLNPMELARAYHDMRVQYSWTVGQLAERLGKKRSSIANTLRYLDLPGELQESLAAGNINAGHAKVLLSAEDSQLQQRLHEEVIAEGLTVRALEQRITDRHSRAPEADPGGAAASTRQARDVKVKAPHIAEQEEFLGRALGTKVEIREGRGRGRILIDFHSTDDYERIRSLIVATSPRR